MRPMPLLRYKYPQAKKMLRVLGRPPRFKDTDRDKVPDIVDCAPFNKRKQGFLHWIQQRHELRRGEKEIAREAVEEGRVNDYGDIQERWTSGGRSERIRKLAKQELIRKEVEKEQFNEERRVAIERARRQARGRTGPGLFRQTFDEFSGKARTKRIRNASYHRRKSVRRRRTSSNYPQYPSMW